MNENGMGNGYIQVVTSNFDASFVDRIVRDGVELYKAQERRFPIERERSLVYDNTKGILAVQYAVEGEVRKVAEFCRGAVVDVVKFVYTPRFEFEDFYLVDIIIEQERKGVIVPCSLWGKKEMLQIFRNHGLVFTLARKESEILQILNNYLAVFLREKKEMIFDPRAGWHKLKDWEYRTADTYPMPEVPAVVQEKRLGIQGSLDNDEFWGLVEWLMGIRKEALRLLLLSILYFGISCSRVFKMTKTMQGKFILFSCRSERVRYFLEKFFSFFIEDSEVQWSLAMPMKELTKVLKRCKDQTVAIDVDAPDISGRRKQNIALLKQFVCGGSLPDGEEAEALVIFITKGIPDGIEFDDAMVFEIRDEDFDSDFLEVGDIRFQSARLVGYFVDDIQKNEGWFERCFSGGEISSSMKDVLLTIGDMLGDIFRENQLFRDPERLKKEYASELEAADEFADVVGIGGIVSEILLSKLQDGKVKLKSVDQEIEECELGTAVLYDKQAFYLSDDLLRMAILPEISASDITPVILRKYLGREGFLQIYGSESGEKSYKKKRLIKAKGGKCRSMWMTAILRKKIEGATGIELADLVEVVDGK